MIEPESRIINAVGGEQILVSAVDYCWLVLRKWRASKQQRFIYEVGGAVKGRQCLIHRIIMAAPKGYDVHHKNGDRSDNRRENLELMPHLAHMKLHGKDTAARNMARRKHPLTGICHWCGLTYIRRFDTRGRQKCCDRKCGLLYARKLNKSRAAARRNQPKEIAL